MASSKQLSSDEVEALIDGLSDESESYSSVVVDSKEVRPFSLGLGNLIGAEGNFATLPDAAKWIMAFGMGEVRTDILK